MRKASSLAAEAAFRARVADLGGVVVGEYVNAHTPVLLRCAEGHECSPMPNSVQKGHGICRTCAGCDRIAAEAAFWELVAEHGAIALGEYVNARTPVPLRCAEGHECSPRPNDVQKGRGICRTCAGQDPVAAEAAFRARVADLGGVVVGEYVNALTPVSLRCAEGHECSPRPHDVQQGRGICGECAGKIWNVFYVVISDLEVKFGITSGDPRSRLSDHRRDGFQTAPPLRLLRDLPGTTAKDIEDACKAALKLAGELPTRGLEYFDISCLALVLDVVDNYPIEQPDDLAA
jgi:formylmethanofuran dehydrogenase subunit E